MRSLGPRELRTWSRAPATSGTRAAVTAVAERAALAQQIPALVERDLHYLQALSVFLGRVTRRLSLPQRVPSATSCSMVPGVCGSSINPSGVWGGSCGKVGAQLFGVQAFGIRRASRLMLAATLCKRAGVDRVETDLVDQLRHRSLRLLVVPGDRDADPLAVAGGTAVVAQARPDDCVERLHHTSARKVGLQQFARSGAVAVKFLEVTVSSRVVVVCVDHDLTPDALDRQLAVTTERHRDNHDIAESRGLFRCQRLSPRPELFGDGLQRGRPARVADPDLVPGIDEVSGKRAADVPRADDPDPHPVLLLRRFSALRTTANLKALFRSGLKRDAGGGSRKSP